MNEEIDETEFYHQDFTTASEWEVFISRMEEVIHQWNVEHVKDVDKESTCQGQWLCKSEDILFADIRFQLNLYRHRSVIISEQPDSDDDDEDKRSKNPIDTDYDFVLDDGDESNPDKCIATWYGLKEYIVLTSNHNSVIVSPSRIKILLSSANVVVGNSKCEIPIFVQIREKWQKLYLGVYEGNGIRTNYDMIHLKRCPQHCKYLSGLLDLFKTKIMSPTPLDHIIISVQLTYHLTDFGKYIWKQELPDTSTDNFDASSLTVLPFGVAYDPVSCIALRATWSHLPDHVIVDSEVYSDLDPMQAPVWSIIVKMSVQPICLMAECLTEFLQLLPNNITVYDLLGDFAVQPSNAQDNPLDLLTEPHIPSLSSVLKRATRRSSAIKNRKGVAPIPEENLEPLIYYLFPDAENQPQFPYSGKIYKHKSEDKLKNDDALLDKTANHDNLFKGFKTCGYDSLVWRLSIVLAQALDSLGGIRALAHMWYEFAQEMRYRWEKGYLIPGLSSGFPDPGTCLLHQKLQMLNCCIERKIARESKLSAGKSFESVEDPSTDEEEFFDCDFENDDSVHRNRENLSLWNQPVGRLGKFENLKLLKTGDPLYIPVTQEPVPKTEDQLEEDTDVLLKLGSDAQGSELRARMMSASLLSDMESFKAANPESILEDFIRWYSPRDWVEDDGEELDEWGQKKGHLSSRMLISDNTWVEMWSSAKPVAANRQKGLFDDTREAEKVLHFLDSRTLSQIAELILPTLCHTAIYRLTDECDQVRSLRNSDTLRQIVKGGERISREAAIPKRRYENLIQEIAAFELSLSQFNSLLYKFNPAGEYDEVLTDYVERLTQGVEIEIHNKSNSKVGAALLTMFSDAQKVANMIVIEHGSGVIQPECTPLPQATEREFAMRVSACRPAIYSSKSPQFLRAVLSKSEFRLCGAFSEDIVFF